MFDTSKLTFPFSNQNPIGYLDILALTKADL